MTSPEPIRIAVIGAGTMGAGVAGVFAAHGHPVSLYSRSETTLASALAAIEARIGDEVDRVTVTTDLAACAEEAGFVSENVVEQLDLKREVFAELERLVPADCILTTNTSSVPITEIASGLETPGRLVGLHWFNPPAVMPLVEVVRGSASDDLTVERVMALCAAIGKEVIEVRREMPGFVINRLQYALLREAIALVESGAATVADVDRAVETTLAPRWSASGPLRLMDLAGLDTVEKVSAVIMPELDTTAGVPEIVSALVAEGALGAKAGRGFYEWTPETLAAAVAERDDTVRALTERRTAR
ncbi:3-hydroxyacyl-CoA dehydrogenase family protein [Rathayibacter tanaceti]|uniref:3-hydroxybutyryl-CoA dehydrogenase n=2 Tax=Rathayibacter tanaceti TaxID=1671680 RepID=A0A162GRF1_9MICO|nr:3-hydroxyacyl-CoA dehydrogenase family protein [Rathayibacter tanaceti]KZX21578.1 3-hydroxybutyryl-CoA dehydrogenase [Rathayibacter tanaceti]QHC56633.1 NAD(P)-binding domain-containing protein [Rathayibacter tanaceti]TCO36222.1 3-hydroxybutyryl-CoA dehydrogenase [Rathayibacter tanaceti]